MRLLEPSSHRTEPRLLQLRQLARQGLLATTFAAASDEEKMWLRGTAYAAAWPVVFMRITRRVELNRGHLHCVKSVHHLADGCLDAFHTDVEASVDDLLTHAVVPIIDLDAWIASRVNAATIDAYRRRRGSRGALQRPRPPKWLIRALHQDEWLVDLATQILIWVGVDATAGSSIWPIDGWASRRAAMTRDLTGSTPATVRREVEFVLDAMREQPKWFERYVETPLGVKHSDIASGGTSLADPETLERFGIVEIDEGRLHELASAALTAITDQIARGDDPEVAVRAVVEAVFCGGTGDESLGRPPQADTATTEISALLSDLSVVDRIVRTIMSIITRREQ